MVRRFLVFAIIWLLFPVGVSADWVDVQGAPDHNGVVSVATPTRAADAALYWALNVDPAAGFGAAPSHPLLIDGNVVFFADKTLYVVDAVNGAILRRGSLTAASNWNFTMPAYGEGAVFVALAGGRMQAISLDSMESRWTYQSPRKGQSNSNVVYHRGRVYTGYWAGSQKDADFVCVDAATGAEQWVLTHKGGFYKAGCYVCDDFLLVGTDDGEGTGGVIDDPYPGATLYSLNPASGEVLDRIDGIYGDIRSTVAYIDGKAYFTTVGGRFFAVPVSENGVFDHDDIVELDLGGPSFSTPTVYKDRAYVGVMGKSGQFSKFGGHHISVIDLQAKKIAYTCPTAGFPQTSGLLTTAYEERDGSVYVYFIENYTPGKLRVIKDRPGQTAMEPVTAGNPFADILFTPAGDQEQYAICGPIVDDDGTFYFKNDSCHIMAVGWGVEKIEVTKAPAKTVYRSGEKFDPAGMEVTATLKNGAKRDVTPYVTIPTEPLDVDDIDVTIGYDLQRYRDGELTDAAKDVQASGVPIPPLYTSVFVEVRSPQETAADAVIKLIDAIGTVTKDSGDAIRAARDAYAALSAAEKLQVTNYGYLARAITAYDTLVNPFKDVTPKDYFYDAVLWAIENDITSGMTANSFGPKQECTRGQVVTFLWRAGGSPKATHRSNPFQDVKSDAYYYDAVLWAVEQNITRGMTATTFGPNVVCTRGQVVTFQWRAAKSPTVTAKVSFSDVKVGAYYEKAVTWAVSKGITNGLTPATFGPDSKCQRSQIVTFLYRGR